MGLDRKVTFTSPPPSYRQLGNALAPRQLTLQMRMIDGQLAFPDEEPPEDWREIRVALASNMVTLRREPDGIRLITWGNSDPDMRAAWDALTQVLVELTGGTCS